MSAVTEWDVPFLLTTPAITLPINQLITIGTQQVGYLMLDNAACSAGRDMRVRRDDLPQLSGEATHLHYTSGYWMRLTVQLWETIGVGGKIALRETKNDLWDLLMLALNSILADSPFVYLGAGGRIQWRPRGSTHDRMLDRIYLLEWPSPASEPETGAMTATFGVFTQYPYVMQADEVDTRFDTSTTLVNPGSTFYWPVVEVYGPSTSFQLINNSVVDWDNTPLQISFDSSLPGGIPLGSGDWAELGFFHNSAYKNGNGPSLKPSIDILTSDFFPLIPGNNALELVGANHAIVKWNPAYA